MGRRRGSILQVIFGIGGRLPWWATAVLALATYALLHWCAVSEPALAEALGPAVSGALTHVALYAQYIVPWVLVVGLLTSLIRRAARAQLAPQEPRTRAWPEEPVEPAEPVCPRCKGRMVVRKAKHGRNSGNEFWGCSRFPACHGTREVATEERYPLSA